MKHRRLECLAVLLASMLSMTTASAAPKQDVDQMMAYDGLAKIKIKDVDMAYARPGVSLAGYKFIKLDPVEVSFRKDWDPKRRGSNLKLSAQDREKIRTGVAKIVHDEFLTELHSRGGYKVVTDPDVDVLRVKVSILNLYVNAPDTGEPGRGRTFTVSAGEMTIFAELFDSESGQLLARVVDRREARNSGRMEISDSGSNTGDAALIANGWARTLRKALDRAHESVRK